jgi:hypothetical protein
MTDFISSPAFVCFNTGAIWPPQNKIISHFSCSIAAFLKCDINWVCSGNGRNPGSRPARSLAIRLVIPLPSLPVKTRDNVVYLAASEKSICRCTAVALDSSQARKAVPIWTASAPGARAAATPLSIHNLRARRHWIPSLPAPRNLGCRRTALVVSGIGCLLFRPLLFGTTYSLLVRTKVTAKFGRRGKTITYRDCSGQRTFRSGVAGSTNIFVGDLLFPEKKPPETRFSYKTRLPRWHPPMSR